MRRKSATRALSHTSREARSRCSSASRLERARAEQILDEDSLDRSHRLVGDPVAAYLVRAESTGGQPVGIQTARLHPFKPVSLDDMDAACARPCACLSSRYSRRMPLDADLLNQAKAAEARAIDAEYHAVFARAEFHQAARRLQLAGASLREIADALGLSHQRVHQIVAGAGGAGAGGTARPPKESFNPARSAAGTKHGSRRLSLARESSSAADASAGRTPCWRRGRRSSLPR